MEKGLRVLVVDDNRDGADTCAMLLQMLGHETRVAYSGKQGIESATQFSPQVALLDIGMPDMNGYDVARALRAQHGKSVVLVAVTGWGQQADKQQAADAGFDHHLVKPVDPAVLEPLLASVKAA